jgi:small subunit ribosomal protein S6
MSTSAPTYDLVMLLDPEAEDEVRAKPLADARAAIESQGELLRHDAWGNRALAYAIHRRSAAEYHLLQFHAASPELLRTLDRSLRIADEVLRFRIVKLKPGTPEAPDMHAAPAPARRAGAETSARATAGSPAAPAAEHPQPDAQAGEPEREGAPAPAPAPEETAPEETASEAAPTQDA